MYRSSLVIVQCAGADDFLYINPYQHQKAKKNTKSDQTFYIISGKLKLIIFDEKGRIKKKIVLSQNDNLYARIKKGVYFCDIALTDKTLHLETKNCIYNNNTNKLANFKFDEKNF